MKTPNTEEKPAPKYYLLRSITIDGEHEHYNHCIVKADSREQLREIEKEIFKLDECGLDAKDAYFGYGDGMTGTKLKGEEEITPEEAATLSRYHCANGYNCDPHLE
jgi:hypothetical protein